MREIKFFHAQWCKPCRNYIENELPKIKKKYTVEMIDCQSNPFAADDYRVQHLPTVLILENGQEIYRGRDKAEKILEIMKNGKCSTIK